MTAHEKFCWWLRGTTESSTREATMSSDVLLHLLPILIVLGFLGWWFTYDMHQAGVREQQRAEAEERHKRWLEHYYKYERPRWLAEMDRLHQAAGRGPWPPKKQHLRIVGGNDAEG